MEPTRPRAVAALALAACALVTSARGYAQGGDDHLTATTLVRQLESDSAHAAVTSSALAHAREALERAVRLRGAGDEAHAKAADGLAREWAETARDLTRAVDTEATAADVRRKAVDAQARVERARALVEAAISHVGRLTAELEAAGRSRPADRTAVEVHEHPATPPRGSAAAPAPDKPAKRPGEQEKRDTGDKP
jgi:hypothetical protein